ncbi:hypothetical protein Ddc_06969 [Ditylenchus destructor]|nr:hypothetical protein Ddc_06969 [Ditylenchus destructor]
MSSDSEDGEIKEDHNATNDQREHGEISDSDFESEKIQIVKRSSDADTLSQHSTAPVENEPHMAMNRVSIMSDVAESLVNRVRRQAARTIDIAETTSTRIVRSDAAARARAIAAANRSKAQAAAAHAKAEAAANLARARAAANLAKSQAATQLARV